MFLPSVDTQLRLFNSLPQQVQSAIVGYANAAKVPPSAAIEFAIAQFLELDSNLFREQPSALEDNGILSELPRSVQTAIEQYAIQNKMPPEFVIELAIAHFLDPDSVTFTDCQISIQREQVERLKGYWHRQPETVV
ncbi:MULTISPECIES: hypothetical protein [Desertifilum]|uniref:Uncharacterized protein n=1 Tax=Desertifilum tharense IPPAS B-1220 TaxID=1781255 RepID=A0ACD5GU22_9CYAN|nr:MULTISPECIES: hypothetical protein [Desertifilum]MDA0209020.1 hypothetical protein [Cyanobacteria bacterium FC1]